MRPTRLLAFLAVLMAVVVLLAVPMAPIIAGAPTVAAASTTLIAPMPVAPLIVLVLASIMVMARRIRAAPTVATRGGLGFTLYSAYAPFKRMVAQIRRDTGRSLDTYYAGTLGIADT